MVLMLASGHMTAACCQTTYYCVICSASSEFGLDPTAGKCVSTQAQTYVSPTTVPHEAYCSEVTPKPLSKSTIVMRKGTESVALYAKDMDEADSVGERLIIQFGEFGVGCLS